MKRIVLGLSGASGAPYARRLIAVLARSDFGREVEVALVLSRTAETVWQHECGVSPRSLGLPVYDGRDYAAPFASGSARTDAMAVVPASMSCMARIAHGVSDDLLTRAADVMLKERRPLVLVPREAPYSSIHLENMLAVTRAGAVVIPASPSFYGRPQTLDDALDSVLSRVLDHLGLPNALTRRWGEDVNLDSAGPGSGSHPEQRDRLEHERHAAEGGPAWGGAPADSLRRGGAARAAPETRAGSGVPEHAQRDQDESQTPGPAQEGREADVTVTELRKD